SCAAAVAADIRATAVSCRRHPADAHINRAVAEPTSIESKSKSKSKSKSSDRDESPQSTRHDLQSLLVEQLLANEKARARVRTAAHSRTLKA
ncbi:MAG TPA: hypothetical protein VGC79_03810, partial [Polyangiaceae bacterium]